MCFPGISVHVRSFARDVMSLSHTTLYVHAMERGRVARALFDSSSRGFLRSCGAASLAVDWTVARYTTLTRGGVASCAPKKQLHLKLAPPHTVTVQSSEARGAHKTERDARLVLRAARLPKNRPRPAARAAPLAARRSKLASPTRRPSRRNPATNESRKRRRSPPRRRNLAATATCTPERRAVGGER